MLLSSYLLRCSRFSGRLKPVLASCGAQLSSAADVPLTKDIHPEIQRGNYGKVTKDDLKTFRDILGKDSVLTDKDDVEAFNVDWMHICRGESSVVLKPHTTQQVSQLLKHCNERRLAVVPQGGNTGLVGGSVSVFDEVVVSTAAMKNIISVDNYSGVLVAEAGCILETLDNHLDSLGFIMPLDLGAKGSCHIGGNVATNAGGLRLLRYGSLRGTVLGLEAVLPNGDILDCLTTLRKDNTGYDLKQLFIGSEGTLGIITKVAVLCPPKPKAINLAFLGCNSFKDVLNTFQKTRTFLSEILSAFEFLDAESMNVVTSNLGLKCPLSNSYPFYVVVETRGSSDVHDGEKVNAFLENVMESSCVQDGIVAQDATQMRNLWAVRERIVEGLLEDGYEYKYDVSMRIDEVYELVEVMRERMEGKVIRTAGYGHVGDGNLHLNFTTRSYDPKVLHHIEPFVFEWLRSRRGSISAEHGLGLKKNQYIGYSKPAVAVDLMQQIKKLFDPNGIMNPYKFLPSSTQ